MDSSAQAFIAKHQTKSTAEVSLLLSKKPDLPKEFIINQINGIQKIGKRFPFLIDFQNYLFPSTRAFSQASSQTAAEYKASLIKGDTLIDLSGGMGMDSYFFSKQFNKVIYIEPNQELFETTSTNFKTLGAVNIECKLTDAQSFLNTNKTTFNWAYLDPDRRVGSSKLFKIEDCEPNVLEVLPEIWKKSKQCLVKLSPMLDLSLALKQLPETKEVHILSIDNDCKELLFLLEENFSEEAIIICSNMEKKKQSTFSFFLSKEKTEVSTFSLPKKFLYDPSVTVLKGGAFKSIAIKFGLSKLSSNTHVYTSEALKKDFPGRTFEILTTSKPQKGHVKKANIVCKNFPLTPDQIKKKYKIEDGGDLFLYAIRLDNDERMFIVCRKID